MSLKFWNTGSSGTWLFTAYRKWLKWIQCSVVSHICDREKGQSEDIVALACGASLRRSRAIPEKMS